jgi:TolB-like protein/Tfp pilus assembly protein PilF
LLVSAVVLIASAAVAFSYFKSSRSRPQPITSIAVLPLVNESADQNMDYLSDGLSESLINSLSQLPQLKVIARSSSFKYKGVTADPPKVAAALGVEAILSGRVSQRGDNLLINVELVDARDNTQVWGEQYNRKATDLLQVQSEISGEIASKLRLRLTGGEQQQLVKRETVNPQAYEMLLKGRFYRSKGGMENLKKAKEYFEQAIVVDPTYAHAYSELSEICAFLVTSSVLDPKDFMPKAEEAARKALELDDSLAEAHLAMAGLRVLTWDWVTAERELKRAIELNPNLARAHRRYAFYLNIRRRHDEAYTEGNRARELDPLTPSFSWLTLQRRYDQALEGLKKALEMGQGNAFVYVQLGVSYAGKGQYAEAIAAYREAIKLGDDSPDTLILLGCAYAMAGEQDQAQAILKRLKARREYVSPGALAVLYVALGDPERALELLERAYVEHDNQLHNLAVHPHLDPLRSDPRFQDLLRRVDLPS